MAWGFFLRLLGGVTVTGGDREWRKEGQAQPQAAAAPAKKKPQK